MVDYVKTIGAGDEMMIRDTGSNVEFWFHSDSATWNNQQDWGWSIDGGGWNMGVFKLNTGGAWHHLGTIAVGAGANRQVGMRMVDEGLGWPTSDFFVTIQRATVPPAPRAPYLLSVSATTLSTQFAGNGDGGSGILEWQTGWGTNPAGPTNYVSHYITNLTGLVKGTTYYFWARGRNAVGWGPWSPRSAFATWREPDAPTPVTFSLITQKSLTAKFTGGFNGGEPVDEWQLAYGLVNEVTQATHITANSGVANLDNLEHGRIYHFWARGRNAVGWGPYSAVRVATLVAGALVKDGLVYKRAVPYVNDEGVWRLARGMAKSSGVWKFVS